MRIEDGYAKSTLIEHLGNFRSHKSSSCDDDVTRLVIVYPAVDGTGILQRADVEDVRRILPFDIYFSCFRSGSKDDSVERLLVNAAVIEGFDD